MTPEPLRILISGAGIAGPTLAWFLARAGAHVTVVEKAPSISPSGQNIDIQGSARTVIDRMGLTAEILHRNTTERGTQFLDPQGRPYARFPVKQLGSPTSEFEILRSDLVAVLVDASRHHPNVTYRFGTTVDEVLANTSDHVQVRLSTGEIQKYDVLVAADGQWSRLRKQNFPAAAVTVVDKGMFAVYWTTPRLPTDNDWWNVYQCLRSRLISLRPDPYGTIRACLTCMPANAAQRTAWQQASRADRQTQADLLTREFADAGWQAQRLLDSIAQAPDFYFQAVQQIKMDRWSSGRIVCLGDTAYAPTPLTGMGTSLAILGAYLLAGELSQLPAGAPPASAFAAYETAFRPFVEKIQQVPFFVPAVAHPGTAFKRSLFRAVLWTVSSIVAVPWIAKRFGGDAGEDFPLPSYPALSNIPDAS